MRRILVTSIWQKPNSSDLETFIFYMDEVKEKVKELKAKGYKYRGSIGRSE